MLLAEFSVSPQAAEEDRLSLRWDWEHGFVANCAWSYMGEAHARVLCDTRMRSLLEAFQPQSGEGLSDAERRAVKVNGRTHPHSQPSPTLTARINQHSRLLSRRRRSDEGLTA